MGRARFARADQSLQQQEGSVKSFLQRALLFAGARPKYHVALFFSLALTGVFLLPFCDAMYNCGCTFPWVGAADFCNIRIADSVHCPWCEDRSLVLQALPFLAIILAQGLALHHLEKRRSSNLLMLLFVSALVFLIVGAFSGYVFKLIDSYPYFFSE